MRTLLGLLLCASTLPALTPDEIIIVVNRAVPSSVELGDYYAKARNIPKDNIVALVLTRDEEITRAEYDQWFVKPLREALAERKNKVKCLLFMSGVPLRVGSAMPSDGDKAEMERLKPVVEAAKTKAASNDAATAARGKMELAKVEAEMLILAKRESKASVDSEMMLLWWDNYHLARWIMNPLHWQAGTRYRQGKPPVMMTARLDGPSPEIVRRLIDDAIAVEKTGLSGKVYVDARGLAFDKNNPRENGGYGYGGYDESMRETAAMFKTAKWNVTLDDKEPLFTPKSCPDTALYCGWYSHGHYVDCCTFQRGAVAWHLASSEAVTLRKPESTLWCPKLLQAGVAVTLGPVAEPYTVGFPKPAEFFGMLATGKYTLAEVNAKTTTFASWMMVCIGDPLYTPFKNKKVFADADLFASPKQGKTLFR